MADRPAAGWGGVSPSQPGWHFFTQTGTTGWLIISKSFTAHPSFSILITDAGAVSGGKCSHISERCPEEVWQWAEGGYSGRLVGLRRTQRARLQPHHMQPLPQTLKPQHWAAPQRLGWPWIDLCNKSCFGLTKTSLHTFKTCWFLGQRTQTRNCNSRQDPGWFVRS